jgi:GTP-binding protein HflX
VQRQSRQSEFTASLVGYTNAGKSSILRALAQAKDIFVEDRLFATLDPLTREVLLGDKQHVLVTDTVGFIRKLPHDLVASFRATLEEAMDAELLLHVIDASNPAWAEQKVVVEGVLEELGLTPRSVILVFNKVDRLTHAEEARLREEVRALYPQSSVFISAVESGGLEELEARLIEELHALRPEVHVMIPSVDGEALASVYRDGEVLSREEKGASIELVVRLPIPALGRLKRREGVEIFMPA